MSEELKLESHYVAFLDVMGYSHFLKNADRKKSKYYFNIIQNLIKSAKELSESYNISYFQTNTSLFGDSVNTNINLFSDNIVISVKCNDNIDKDFSNYLGLIEFTIHLQLKALAENNIFLRGGIAKGDFIRTDELIFGEALIDSYHLESVANYPRVILREKDIKYFDIAAKPDKYLRYIVKDNDVYFVNHFLGQFHDIEKLRDVIETPVIPDFNEVTLTRINNKEKSYLLHREDIRKGLLYQIDEYNTYVGVPSSEVNTRFKLIQRLAWLINYYNICCESALDSRNDKIHYETCIDSVYLLPKIVLLEDEQEEQS